MSADFRPDRPRARSATDIEKGILTELGFTIDHAEWNGHRVPQECEVYLRFFDFVRAVFKKALLSHVHSPHDPWWAWLQHRSLEEVAWWFHKHQQGLSGVETVRDVANTAEYYQRLFALFAEHEILGKVPEQPGPEPGPTPKTFYNWKTP